MWVECRLDRGLGDSIDCVEACKVKRESVGKETGRCGGAVEKHFVRVH